MNRTWLAVLLAVLVANVVALLLGRQRQDHRFDAEIRAAAARYGIAPALVKAVVRTESNFNAAAQGRAGELGLMQLMEETAFEWAGAASVTPFAHEHALDPRTNTLAGAFYLAKLLRRYRHADNPLPYALADYNAGRANVLKWAQGDAATNSAAFLAAVGFPGTRAYVQQVTRRYEAYLPTFR